MSFAEPLHFACEMSDQCRDAPNMVDKDGYIYCEWHGEQRQAWKSCRMLTAKELAALSTGTRPRYAKQKAGV